MRICSSVHGWEYVAYTRPLYNAILYSIVYTSLDELLPQLHQEHTLLHKGSSQMVLNRHHRRFSEPSGIMCLWWRLSSQMVFKPSVKKAITDGSKQEPSVIVTIIDGSCWEPSMIVYFYKRFWTRTVCDSFFCSKENWILKPCRQRREPTRVAWLWQRKRMNKCDDSSKQPQCYR